MLMSRHVNGRRNKNERMAKKLVEKVWTTDANKNGKHAGIEK
jgi:hypothetical protein